MTQEEFIANYCQRSKVSREFYDTYYVALPCECGEDICKGWASIHLNAEDVLDHVSSMLGAEYLNLLTERNRLRDLASTCYAGLGAECNLPDKWLDAFVAASDGEYFTTDSLLPFTLELPTGEKDV